MHGYKHHSRLLAFTVLLRAHQSLVGPHFLPLVCNYNVYYSRDVRDVSCCIITLVGKRSVLGAMHTSIVAKTASFVDYRS